MGQQTVIVVYLFTAIEYLNTMEQRTVAVCDRLLTFKAKVTDNLLKGKKYLLDVTDRINDTYLQKVHGPLNTSTVIM